MTPDDRELLALFALFVVVGSFFIWYNFRMADPVWGLLPKAQDDPQLISEAISAAIAAHEADPEAHLGDGESLEAHRANEVIDHPVGSLLGDKISMSEILIHEDFKDISRWIVHGDYEIPGGQGVVLDVFSPTGVTYILDEPFNGNYLLVPTYPQIFQVGVNIQSDEELARVFIGVADFNTPLTTHLQSLSHGVGFLIEDGVMKGIVKRGGTTLLTASIAFDYYSYMSLRFQFNVADNSVEFYKNGELAGTLSLDGTSGALGSGIWFRLDGDGTTDFYDIALASLMYNLPIT